MSVMAPGKKAFVYTVKLSAEVQVYADNQDEAFQNSDPRSVDSWDMEIISTDTNEPTEPED